MHVYMIHNNCKPSKFNYFIHWRYMCFLILFIVQFLLVFSLHLEESVLENARSGTDVVLLSIAYIHQVAIFQDDNNLLKRIAFVETKDGAYLDPFNSGGIWAVDEDTFLSTQINKNSNITLFQKYEEIRLLFGIEWDVLN